MNSGTGKILLVALVAGTLGLVASFVVNGPGPLWRTEVGQRLLQSALSRSAPRPPAGTPVATRGAPLPAVSLPGLDGRLVELPAAYRGRPLLINVWATWCAPCVREMPELERFSSEQAANGLQVVGIALDDAQSVRTFLARVPVTYPILLDTPGPGDAGVRLGNPKGVLPYSILVSSDGRLLRQRIGPFTPGELDEWVRR